jgi:hypothetical protein
MRQRQYLDDSAGFTMAPDGQNNTFVFPFHLKPSSRRKPESIEQEKSERCCSRGENLMGAGFRRDDEC